MSTTSSVLLDIVNTLGQVEGTIQIHTLPKHTPLPNPPLWDYRENAAADPTVEPVQIQEGAEYRFRIMLPGEGPVTTDKPELFEPDDSTGTTGRLKPGLHTGGLPVRFFVSGEYVGSAALEVRSTKLDYLRHYRWMLRDIASTVAEIVAQHFAPTMQRFVPDPTRDGETLYQQFAFLYSFLTSETFATAIAQIAAFPHRTWVAIDASQRPSAGLRGNSALLRQLMRPGPRVVWPNSPIKGLTSLPENVDVKHRIESVDTPENRFIKFALNYWRGIAARIGQVLQAQRKTYSVERGVREVEHVLLLLDALLSRDFFRQIGDMAFFPLSSPVLNRQEGYLEIFQAYLQSELAAKLRWEGGEDIYGGGQRDVATLYEYWAFLQLANCIAQICNSVPFTLNSILRPTSSGLDLQLQRGSNLILRGSVEKAESLLDVQLFYNRTFTARPITTEASSWSRSMRPDFSLKLTVSPNDQNEKANNTIWLHFDAKYRVDKIVELFGERPANYTNETFLLEDEHTLVQQGAYRRGDLLRMHAYKDAVRRSTGAFILYPGTETELMREFHEILPGIGAFPLVPTETEVVEGELGLSRFLNDVVEHLARQAHDNKQVTTV